MKSPNQGKILVTWVQNKHNENIILLEVGPPKQGKFM